VAKKTFDYSTDSKAAPAKFMAAATDFTDNRPKLWPNLSPNRYKVYSVGDHVADIGEGTGPGYGRFKYDWTDDMVRAVATEATATKPGALWQMTVKPREGGGSHVEVHQELEFTGPIGFIFGLTVGLSGGAKFFEKGFLKTVALLEAEG
jgi:hypothetical protein